MAKPNKRITVKASVLFLCSSFFPPILCLSLPSSLPLFLPSVLLSFLMSLSIWLSVSLCLPFLSLSLSHCLSLFLSLCLSHPLSNSVSVCPSVFPSLPPVLSVPFSFLPASFLPSLSFPHFLPSLSPFPLSSYHSSFSIILLPLSPLFLSSLWQYLLNLVLDSRSHKSSTWVTRRILILRTK